MKKLWIPVAIVLVLVAAWFIPIAVFDARISRAKAGLRADGHPAELPDLAPMFAVGSESSAALLDSAGACFDRQDRGRLALADSVGWQADPAGTRALLEQKSAAFPLLMRAAGMPGARFGFPYRDGIAARIADLTRFSAFRSFLWLEARQLAASGQADSALAILDAVLYLSEALAEPVFIYHMVNTLGFDTTISRIARVAPHASASVLERVVTRLERLDFEAGLLNAVRSEAVMMQSGLAEGYPSLVDEYSGQPPAFPWMKLAPLRKFSQASQLEFARAHLRLCRLDWPEAEPVLDSLKASHSAGGPVARMARYGVLNPGAAYIRTKRCVALQRAAIVGLKALIALRSTGRLPASLAAVASPAPLDPFSSKELIYRTLPGGYVVYSVGKDGKDDGGDEQADVTFRIRLR